MLEIKNYINGTWRNSAATEFKNVFDPANGELLARTPLSPAAEVDQAVQTAAAAFPAWQLTPAVERIQHLFNLKVLMEDHWPSSPSAVGKRASPAPSTSKAAMALNSIPRSKLSSSAG